MISFTLPTRPWTTPNVCATVIRASSCVNRSSLWSTASISLSPNNFFANFSVAHSATDSVQYVHIALTEPSLSYLFRSKGKHGEQFDHYLYNHIHHHRREIDLCVNVETLDETPQMLKEVREGVIA